MIDYNRKFNMKYLTPYRVVFVLILFVSDLKLDYFCSRKELNQNSDMSFILRKCGATCNAAQLQAQQTPLFFRYKLLI